MNAEMSFFCMLEMSQCKTYVLCVIVFEEEEKTEQGTHDQIDECFFSFIAIIIELLLLFLPFEQNFEFTLFSFSLFDLHSAV